MLLLTASLGVEWVCHVSHFGRTMYLRNFFRLQRSHFLVFSADILTEPGTDPYTRDEQTNFAKWCVGTLYGDSLADCTLYHSDAMCPGMFSC
jgi:hypothetical protein